MKHDDFTTQTFSPIHSQTKTYHLAGRDPTNEFKDLRSARHARNRLRTESEKYYNYRHVKRGQIGVEHLPDHSFWRLRGWRNGIAPFPSPGDTSTFVMTKAMFYQEAQNWPRPPTHHHAERDRSWTTTSLTRRKARKRQCREMREDLEEAVCAQFCCFACDEVLMEEMFPDWWDLLNGDWIDDESLFGVDGVVRDGQYILGVEDACVPIPDLVAGEADGAVDEELDDKMEAMDFDFVLFPSDEDSDGDSEDWDFIGDEDDRLHWSRSNLDSEYEVIN